MSEEKKETEEEPWQIVQKKTFTRWCNMYLTRRNFKVEDLYKDFANGVNLCNLLEIITGEKLAKYSKRPRNRFQKLNNLNIALDFIMKKKEITLVNIGADDLLEENPKLVLGLIWTLILKLQIGDSESESSAKNELLKWVNEAIKPYEKNVKQCKNFTSSFKDGKALCALCEFLAEDSPFESCKNLMEPEDAITAALNMAETEFEIPQLMDMEDIIKGADAHSMMTYVSMFRDWQETGEFQPDTDKCYAEGPGVSMGMDGKELPFTIFCRDQNGKLSPAPEQDFLITIKDEGENQYDCKQEESSQGIIDCGWEPDGPGEYTIAIVDEDGNNIRDSPYTCKVIEEGERKIQDPPEECICTIFDKYKEYHSYISDDGDCVNKYGDILGFINLENLEVGSPESRFWGEVNDERVYNSYEREIGQIDQGKGTIIDADGNTVVEINRIGEFKGKASITLGHIEGFSYKNLSVIALYLLIVDDDLLVEEEDD